MVEELTKDEIKRLRRTARKFLYDESKTDEEKVDILFYWWQFCLITQVRFRLL